MKVKVVYLDASVIIVLLFGREKEAERYAVVTRLFQAIDAGTIIAFVSVYTLQEVCLFCRDHFTEPERAAALALQELFQHTLRVVPLLTRTEKMIHSRTFQMHDPSDQAHAIAAFLHKCDALIAYDEHFRDIADRVPYLQPEELLPQLEKAPAAKPEEPKGETTDSEPGG